MIGEITKIFIMKKIFLIVLITSSYCFSQKNTFKINYDFNLNLGNFQEFKSTLYVDNNSSIFLWNKPLNKPTNDDENNVTINLNELDSIGSFNFKNFSKDTIYSRIPYFKKEILLLEEKTPTISWEIFNEIRKIGPYECQKAISKFRGRNYIAWFTNEIPIKSGPWKLQGLPGLIIVAYDTTREVQFTFTSISKSEYKINPILKANRVISLEYYKKMSKSSSQDFIKKLKSKLPRGAKIKVNSKKGIEIFNE